MKFYGAAVSGNAYKVRILLELLKIPHEKVLLDFAKREHKSAEYLKINPKGVVPSLAHDGGVVVESTLICEYLDEVFPSPALRPADALGRARMRLWSKAIDEGIFEATREISFSAMFRERMRNMTEEQRQTRFRNVGDPERRARYISTYEEGVESVYVFQGIANYEKLFKSMDEALAAGSPWMTGERFTLGDINLMPFVARIEYLDLLPVWTADRPRVLEWWARAKARPSFVQAIASQLAPEEEIGRAHV